MEFKKSMIILIMAIFLVSIAGVCAADANDTMVASDDANQIEVSSNDVTAEDDLQASEENTTLTQTNDDETLSAQADSEILSEGEGTYYDLRDEIGSGGYKSLTKRYYSYTGGNTIEITTSGVINGNGAVIDMSGSSIRAFHVKASGVTIRNLTIKNANYYPYTGGAIHFSASGTVENCNFINNTADSGGAIYFESDGTVRNCNFADNHATFVAGAICFSSRSGSTYTLTNCNFTNNNASYRAGAVWMSYGSVTNCNFANNHAFGTEAGALYLTSGSVTNCNFTNNTSPDCGGAVEIFDTSDVTNCIFTGNIAASGSAIYFCNYYNPNTVTVSNSIFLNNRAHADDDASLNITKNENNITITFMGHNNLINAIYSAYDGEVSFTNVTYWGVNGITNTGNSTIKPSRSNKEAGQNITVGVVVNDEIVLNEVKVTDENGTIVLDIKVDGNYYIRAHHGTDSYYTEAETISTNMEFYVNVTETKTTNKTVNITAKSNIKPEVMPAKLLLILPNGLEINMTYDADGIWWAEYTFADYIDYQVNASYIGYGNVTISNATISISKADSTISLDVPVLEYGTSVSITVNTTGVLAITAEIYDGQILAVMRNVIIIPDDLEAGPYSLIITTIPDADHNEIKKTVPIYIQKAKTQFTASAVNATYNINKELVITLTDSHDRLLKDCVVSVDLNGIKNYTTDSNGQITVSTQGLTPKVYSVNIAFEGKGNYDKSNATTTVTINKDSTSLTAGAVTAVYNVNKNLVITLKDSRGNPIKGCAVTVDLNGVKTFTTDAKGQVKVPTGSLAAKAYTAKITFKGNGNYLASSKEIKVTVKKATPKLTAKSKKFKRSVKVKKYTIVLKSNVGKAISKAKVTLKIKGKKAITVKTNAKGKAVFKIKKLTKKGKYTATVTYKGDKCYNKVTKKVKITVK